MAVIETSRFAPTARKFIFTAPLIATFVKVKSWNDVHQTRKALKQLSARELEDVGLTYADVDAL
jgi:uncharacterized protein YjiS (DUF1127 family)